MRDTIVQSNASQIPETLISEILRHVPGYDATSPPASLTHRCQFSNDLAEARLEEGRSLIVKRGRNPWSRDR